MKDRTCLMCNQPMKLSKKFESRTGKQGVYRVRRFNCTICDYSELITADGSGEKARERQALNDQQKLYTQQSDNETNRI